MQQILESITQILPHGHPVLTADDLGNLDGEVRQTLLSLGILKPTRAAAHVVCDACFSDHVEKVERIKDSKSLANFRIRCPEAGWVEVRAERLLQWTVDVHRLVTLLSESLGTGQTASRVYETIWRLGNIDIGDNRFGIVFVLNGDGADENTLSAQLRKLGSLGQTILIGVNGVGDLADAAAASTLFDAFAFVNGQFTFGFKHIHLLLAESAEPKGNVFRRKEDFWQISFAGKSIKSKDKMGLGYIARLLDKPDRLFPAVALRALQTNTDPRVASGSVGEYLDKPGYEKFRESYEELAEELAEARANNDHGRVERVLAEMQQIYIGITRLTGLGNRRRKNSDAENARISVTQNVKRAIKSIASHHAALGRHLKNSIQTGLTCFYSPEKPIDWLT